MKDDIFQELVASVREGGAILRGEAKPSRAFVADGPTIRRFRTTYRLSQTQFAEMFGISVRTLQNWEQGRRMPEGPARVLLHVAAKHPQAVWDVVQTASQPLRQAAKAQRPTKKAIKHPVTMRGTKAKRSPKAT
jgi:putative transcriptional regulator